jgi:type I site-specific restriction endonuclease
VLTTGWDFPGLEHIVMARPTKSLSLYTQILGRATRPLPGVVDFPDSTPELRRAAIFDSAKPNFKMTDLVDISLSHRICTTIDALEGEMDESLRDRLIAEVTDQGIVDMQRKMEELKRKIEDEERTKKAQEAERVRRQQMLFEARRRQGIRAHVEYDTVAVDVLDAPGIKQKGQPRVHKGPTAIFGKYKGIPLKDIPIGYLSWKLANIEKLPPWYKQQITNAIADRMLTNAGTR